MFVALVLLANHYYLKGVWNARKQKSTWFDIGWNWPGKYPGRHLVVGHMALNPMGDLPRNIRVVLCHLLLLCSLALTMKTPKHTGRAPLRPRSFYLGA
jgi:hypothetical protein